MNMNKLKTASRLAGKLSLSRKMSDQIVASASNQAQKQKPPVSRRITVATMNMHE